MRKLPLTMDIALICFFIPLKKPKNLFMAIAESMNGIPRPREYALSNAIPFPIVSEVLAYKRMEASIGPMQGVQPAANTIPTNIEPR